MVKKQQFATAISARARSALEISQIPDGPEKTATMSAAATGSKKQLACQAMAKQEE